jgi:photosystem II stability/assembly factor-like uncharacterized protein
VSDKIEIAMKKSLLFLFLLLYFQSINGQWIQQNSGTTEKLTDVIMLNSVTAIVVGKGRSILRTTNTGRTWENLTIMLSSTVPWNCVSFLDTTCGIVGGDGGIRITSDGGRIWLWNSIPYFRKYSAVLYLAPGNIYVGADSGWIFHSLDSGKTWSSEKISNDPIRSLFIWQGPFIQSLPIYALTPNSLFTKMEFPSGEWKETALLFLGLGSEAFDGEFCRGGGPGYIVGVQGDLRAAPTVLRKSMSDTVWRSVSNGILRDGVFLGVSAPSEDVIYVCGTDGMIFKSTNGGDSWTDEIVPTTKNINAIYFYDESNGFVVGDSGVILYTSNGGLTNIDNQEDFLPIGFMLYQNYPNPFNPTTKIKFSIPTSPLTPSPYQGEGHRERWVTLKVYDILGNEIATIFNEEKPAGNYEVEFDGSNLSSGIYFYVLNAGGQSFSKKMCLIK